MNSNTITNFANLFNPPLPNTAGTRFLWGGLHGAAAGLAIANTAKHYAGLVLVVAENVQAAMRLEQEVRFFTKHTDLEILKFPDWETLPYDVFSPLPELVSERLLTLYRLANIERGILIVPAATMLQRLPPRSYLDAHTLLLNCGDKLDPEHLYQRLIRAGYTRVAQVFAHGEFAVRGSLIDLFPTGATQPLRLDLLDNQVETIRTFDPDTQRSQQHIPAIRFLPAKEIPLDEDAVAKFRQAFRTTFAGDPQRSLIYREVSAGHVPGGIEYYLPLFYAQTSTLFDYLPQRTLAIQWDTTHVAINTFLEQTAERYEQRRHDIERPLLPPSQIYLATAEFNAALKNLASVQIQAQQLVERRRGFAAVHNFATNPLPLLTEDVAVPEPVAGTVRRFDKLTDRAENGGQRSRLQEFLAQPQLRVLFLAESPGRREHLLSMLKELGINAQILDDWNCFLAATNSPILAVAPLEHGLFLTQHDDSNSIAVIPEAVLYGERVLQERRRHKTVLDPDQIVRSLTELHLGDPVVHEQHGIGRYLGLQTLNVGGIETELLTLEYQNGDKLYVPVAALHLISRYAGASPENAPLHRLGGDQWDKIKRRAAAKIRDVAAELLDIQAQRAAHPSVPILAADADYAKFASAFLFEETPDQQQAITAVLNDLAAPRPMDRVICGDVGFGKTEVAMRASFQVIQSGQQVAVLVPTTLLAEQHYTNFCDRFADWPIRIESISRFRTQKEQKIIATDLANGKIDLIIGTHKLLQPEFCFHQLGLVVVDEEHRFGVRDKERLKALRTQVDLLTLTATPIPRTLNMALAGMRDLSIIATPPAGRHPIKTFVGPWNDALVVEACQRELKRGGQIYFLHNEVRTIESAAAKLQALLPNIRCEIAHGQMRERALERVMQDFYHQRFNVLVCTTIIESGIDVPSANTIIIDRADKLGLAQLHQIRGRVGRSHHRAYAYFITPPPNAMTTDAKKRLEAIESMEDLGAGFTLATHDLEIRGAGELLGAEQSGQIQEIGFNLYMELLERAVQAIQSGEQPELLQPLKATTEIDLHLSALLPNDYLPDVHSRLVFYKRIANAATLNELRELQVELIDRFGLLPPQAKNLFAIAELKLDSVALGIRKIEAGPNGGRIVFDSTTKIDPTRIIQLMQRQPKDFRFVGGDTLRFNRFWTVPEVRLEGIKAILQELQ